MDVSIVIPNYNGMKYMENCLRALEKQRVEGEPETEILVVDNGSKDGSRELVEEKFPRCASSPWMTITVSVER